MRVLESNFLITRIVLDCAYTLNSILLESKLLLLHSSHFSLITHCCLCLFEREEEIPPVRNVVPL